MLWEKLVSDGHVRSARLRYLQPFIIGTGVILTFAGLLLFILFYKPSKLYPIAQIVQERLRKEQQTAWSGYTLFGDTSQYMADANRAGKKTTDFIAEANLVQVTDDDLRALDNNGKFSEEKVLHIEQTPEEFWKGTWQAGKIGYVRNGDAYLVGAIVYGQTENQPRPGFMRWIGVFKKSGGKWHYASLDNGNLFLVPKRDVVSANHIALTLQSFLPEKKITSTEGK